MSDIDLAKEVRLAQLRAILGLTIDDCIEHFKTPEDAYYEAAVAEAQDEPRNPTFPPVVEPSDGGVNVLSWIWVSHSDAGATVINHFECCGQTWTEENDSAYDLCQTCKKTVPSSKEDLLWPLAT